MRIRLFLDYQREKLAQISDLQRQLHTATAYGLELDEIARAINLAGRKTNHHANMGKGQLESDADFRERIEAALEAN